LALLGHALALGHLHQHGLDHHRRGVVLFDFYALFEHDFLALAGGALAHGQVLRHFALFTAGLDETVNPRPHPLGRVAP
jgi:hypothetical protein